MPKRYTLRIHPTALSMLYTISHGLAAQVTAALRTLQIDPQPCRCKIALGATH